MLSVDCERNCKKGRNCNDQETNKSSNIEKSTLKLLSLEEHISVPRERRGSREKLAMYGSSSRSCEADDEQDETEEEGEVKEEIKLVAQ